MMMMMTGSRVVQHYTQDSEVQSLLIDCLSCYQNLYQCYCHIAYSVQLLAVSHFIIVDHRFSKLFCYIKFVVSDLYCYMHIFLEYINECETNKE